MAVLKSLELEGNKLSFANWISNLSPTCTPFTCMIGKERIDQAQYEWQTDTLAPASAETFDEGSQAVLQPRASTKVLTNFTATLRRAVNVSDTNQAVKAYGRNDEMRYQLGKAGKELMRDLEFANLSKTVGNIGNSTTASQYSGFKELVAKANHPDQDTQAIVHKEIPFWGDEGSSYVLKNLFNVTNNLFVAGSKANKIMFHPKHMFIFNDYISYNDEEPLMYRMFDNLDTRYNAHISRVKDPLGRVYDLIPNRFMPEDEIYIFNENDWTQMILRSPQRVKIGKTGPSQTVMIETEVGLRHRHPYASGILTLKTINKKGTLHATRETLTAYTGDTTKIVEITVLDEVGDPVPAFNFTWESSDPSILELTPTQEITDAHGQTHASMIPHKPGVVSVRAVGDKMVTEPLTITVKEPSVKMNLDSDGMNLGERITCTTVVENIEGGQAADGTVVTFNTNSSKVFFLEDPADINSGLNSAPTVGGLVTSYIACEAPGTYLVWTSVNGVSSNRRTIYVGSAQLQIGWVQKQDVLTLDKDGAITFQVVVKDKDGVHIHENAEVKWFVDTPSLVELSEDKTLTNDIGETAITITPLKVGRTNLVVHCYGDEIILPITVAPIQIDTVMIPENIPFLAGQPARESKLSTFAYDGEGNPIQGARVGWTVTPGTLLELDSVAGITDASGEATTQAKGLAKGRGTVVATVNGVPGTPIKFTVGQDGVLKFHIAPNPTRVGQETILSGTLESMSGLAIADEDITFFIEQTPHTPIPKTTTQADGSFEQRVTPLVDGDFTVDAICASLQTAVKVNLEINT